MLVVALLFLILLFNLPSGLVLYWTMNNVFSFLRLFITNPEVFASREGGGGKFNVVLLKKHLISILPKLKKSLVVITTFAILFQLNWAFHHSFNDIVIRLIYAFVSSILLTLLIAVLNLIYIIKTPFEGKGVKEIFSELWLVFKTFFFFITLVFIVVQVNWALNHNFNDFIVRVFISVVSGFLVTVIVSLIVLLYQDKIIIEPRIVKLNILSFNRRQKNAFWIVLVVLSLLQINWALHYSFNDIIIRLLLVFVGSWIFLVLIANTSNEIKHLCKLFVERIKSQLNHFKFNIYAVFLVFALIAILFYCFSKLNLFDTLFSRVIVAIVAGVTIVPVALIVYNIAKLIMQFFGSYRLKPSIYITSLFVTGYFYLAGKYYFPDVHDGLLKTALLVLIPLEIFNLQFFFSLKHRISKLLFYTLLFPVFIFLSAQLLYLCAIAIDKSFTIPVFGQFSFTFSNSLAQPLETGLILLLIILPFHVWFSNIKATLSTNLSTKQNQTIFFLSVFSISTFIFIWNPITVFSTSPESFSFTAFDLLKANVLLLIAVILVSYSVYIILSWRFKNFAVKLILVLTVVSFINGSLLPIDMGTLQMQRFSDTSNLHAPYWIFLVEVIGIIAIYNLISYLLKRNYFKQISFAIVILILIPTIQGVIVLSQLESHKNKNINEQKPLSSSISFSKQEENVVILMLDMFQGWYLNNVLEEMPLLRESFEGFVWYPNTVSVSNFTISSMPALIGGHEYTPHKLDADSTSNLYQKMTHVSELFRDKVKANGFSFSSNTIPWSSIDKETFDTYIPNWHKDWDYLKDTLSIGENTEINYSLLWKNAVFFCSPMFIKPIVYDKGKWMNSQETKNNNSELAVEHNFLRTLPYISDSKASKASFILLCSKATHFPWDIVDEKGTLIRDVGPFVNYKWSLIQVEKWLQWMKENGVYDNTKIIIVSDHGIRHTRKLTFEDSPFTENRVIDVPLDAQMAFTPLLMVKDFNSVGILKEDSRLMSNADVTSIAFGENDPTKTIDFKPRTLDAFFISWKVKPKDKQYPIEAWYKISENVYDLSNWRLIEQTTKGGS